MCSSDLGPVESRRRCGLASVSARPLAFAGLCLLMATGLWAQMPKLMLFGGPKRDVYLGCLNCDAFASDSICNEFGEYGSEVSANSIWNPASSFGDQSSTLSPWNELGTRAPAIRDPNGNFYGYLSRNISHMRRTDLTVFQALLDLVGKLDLASAQKAFCSSDRK